MRVCCCRCCDIKITNLQDNNESKSDHPDAVKMKVFGVGNIFITTIYDKALVLTI